METAFPARLGGARILLVALAFTAVAAVGAASGGFFATTWNWTTLGFGWAAALALALRRQERWRAEELLIVGAFAAVAAWIWLSALWTIDVTQTVLEGQRALVFPAAALALFAVIRRGEHWLVLAGVLTAIVTVSSYSLATRLFPNRLGYYDVAAVYRLSTPVGYWNALGIFAVFGILLALAFLLESRKALVCALCGASLVVLSLVLYFTYSRGSLAALAIGLAVLFALSPKRWTLLALALATGAPVVVAVVLASRSDALTRRSASLTKATDQGHRLALLALALAVLAALAASGVAMLARRVELGHEARRVASVLVVLAAVVTVALGLVWVGGPVRAVERSYDSFRGPPIGVGEGGNLNARLFSFSSNGRLEMWGVARDEFVSSPVVGDGAGSFTLYWAEHRPRAAQVLDAHGIYVEQLAELGVIGLVLLVAAFVLPLARLRELRRVPLGAAGIAVWVAYLFHTGVDWDWEMPLVTLTALFIVAAPLSALRSEEAPGRGLRLGAGGLAVCFTLAALVFLPGNLDIAKAQNANDRNHFAAAAKDAKSAQRWAPWSSQPAYERAVALDSLGRRAEAIASARKGLSHSPNSWQLWALIVRAGTGRERRQAVERLRTLNRFAPELPALEKAATPKTVAKRTDDK